MGGRPPPGGRQTAPVQPVVDAGVDWVTGEQLVVWGAGEDLVASRRPSRWGRQLAGRLHETVAWRGAGFGYRSGFDDITGIVLCGRDGDGSGPARFVAVGRATGDVCLHSTEGVLPLLHRLETTGTTESADGDEFEVRSMDCSRRFVATGMREGSVFLHSLPEDNVLRSLASEPVLRLDMENDRTGSRNDQIHASIRCIKLVRDDLLVVGLVGQERPLRYIRLTESGHVTEFAPRNPLYDLGVVQTTVRAIQPLCANDTKLGHLVLGAWDDGTIR